MDKGNTQLSEVSLSLMCFLKLHLLSKTHLLTLDVYTCFSQFGEFGFYLTFSNLVIVFFFFSTREVGILFKPVLFNV